MQYLKSFMLKTLNSVVENKPCEHLNCLYYTRTNFISYPSDGYIVYDESDSKIKIFFVVSSGIFDLM